MVGLAGASTIGTQIVANAYTGQFHPMAIRSTGLGWVPGIGRSGASIKSCNANEVGEAAFDHFIRCADGAVARAPGYTRNAVPPSASQPGASVDKRRFGTGRAIDQGMRRDLTK